jgi:riboflavin kinase/FMN adenylyltransferase
MKIISGTLDFRIPEESAVTLGKFDGIHRGHQKLINKIIEKKDQGRKAVVFTFGKMPGTVLFGKKGRTILTTAERQKHLTQMGVDYMIECPFVESFMKMEPEAFIEEILVKRLHAKYIAVGPDYRFGYQRRGDCEMLKSFAEKYDFEVEVLEKECLGERHISSSYVRESLENGEMDTVRKLLGYPYYVSGTVVHGHRIGRTLGIPTTNILPDDEKMLPPNGVYLTKTIFGENAYFGITNIGVKPTISGQEAKGIETHLFDFEGDLYDQELIVQFYAFEREECRFASLEELKNQLEQDVQWGRKMVEEGNVSS